MDSPDPIWLASQMELEDLGWAEVAERTDRWALNGYEGDWQDARYDLPEHWSWPDFGEVPL